MSIDRRRRVPMRRSPIALLLAVLVLFAERNGLAAPGQETEPVDGYRDPADYRVRSEDVSLEFLTLPLIKSLRDHDSPSSVMGEAPWEWQRAAPLTERTVILQVVPDLRWTGGSYFRVTGRVVSYPILAGVIAGATLFVGLFAAMAGADELPDFITPSAPFWRPARAAYHFKEGFQEVRLLRDGLVVPPISGQQNCGTTKVWVARRATQKPRWRTIRGCWGCYTYPGETFAPGGALEVSLLFDGEDLPRIVPLPPDLVPRIAADFSASQDSEPNRLLP